MKVDNISSICKIEFGTKTYAEVVIGSKYKIGLISTNLHPTIFLSKNPFAELDLSENRWDCAVARQVYDDPNNIQIIPHTTWIMEGKDLVRERVTTTYKNKKILQYKVEKKRVKNVLIKPNRDEKRTYLVNEYTDYVSKDKLIIQPLYNGDGSNVYLNIHDEDENIIFSYPHINSNSISRIKHMHDKFTRVDFDDNFKIEFNLQSKFHNIINNDIYTKEGDLIYPFGVTYIDDINLDSYPTELTIMGCSDESLEHNIKHDFESTIT